MTEKMSFKKATVYVGLIGAFYIISGVWEILVGLTQAESIFYGRYYLLDVYRAFAMSLGLITICVGIGFLFKKSLFRLPVLILAWANLFIAPIVEIWWPVYAILLKKFSSTSSWLGLCLQSITIIGILTIIRLYIIKKLNKF